MSFEENFDLTANTAVYSSILQISLTVTCTIVTAAAAYKLRLY